MSAFYGAEPTYLGKMSVVCGTDRGDLTGK